MKKKITEWSIRFSVFLNLDKCTSIWSFFLGMIHPFSIWYYSISAINFLVSASVIVFTLNQCGWKKKKKVTDIQAHKTGRFLHSFCQAFLKAPKISIHNNNNNKKNWGKDFFFFFFCLVESVCLAKWETWCKWRLDFL